MSTPTRFGILVGAVLVCGALAQNLHAADNVLRDAFARIPVMLIHGKDDRTVLFNHSARLCEAMQDKQYPCVLHAVGGAAHQDAIVEEYQSQIADYFEAPPQP